MVQNRPQSKSQAHLNAQSLHRPAVPDSRSAQSQAALSPASWPCAVSSCVISSTAPRASRPDKSLWAALRSQTNGAPSPYSLAEWSDAIPRMREAEIEENARARRERKDAVDSRLYGEDAQWMARVAKLETSSLNSQKTPSERLRLALALIAKKADFDRAGAAGAAGFEAEMAKRVWMSAKHFNAWNNRDHGPIHTAKRMRFFADLLRGFAGGCLRAWQLGNEAAGEPALHDAHVQESWTQATALALRAASVALSAEALGVNPADASQSGEARARSGWVGRVASEDLAPLHQVFMGAWAQSQDAFAQTVKNLGGDALALPVILARTLAGTTGAAAADWEPREGVDPQTAVWALKMARGKNAKNGEKSRASVALALTLGREAAAGESRPKFQAEERAALFREAQRWGSPACAGADAVQMERLAASVEASSPALAGLVAWMRKSCQGSPAASSEAIAPKKAPEGRKALRP